MAPTWRSHSGASSTVAQNKIKGDERGIKSSSRVAHIANLAGPSHTLPQSRSRDNSQTRNGNGFVDSNTNNTAARHAMPIMSPPQKSIIHLRKPLSSPPADSVLVFVGPEQQEFLVNRALLCACSPFFGDHLSRGTNQLSLPNETSSMFELFTVWLHSPVHFPKHLQRALRHASPAPGRAIDSADASSRLHWTLVRLHLFAAMLELLPLQDLAMDAIQDLYLRRDWDVTPQFVRFLYSQCDPFASLRLRRWAVAMVAYSLATGVSLPQGADTESAGYSSGSNHIWASSTGERDTKTFYTLLERYPEFTLDYNTHLRKMEESGLDLAMKNPQLRIPSNALRNNQRRFAFRQCAFHTHRATAGQGTCPYGGDEDDVEGRIGIIRQKSRRARQKRRQMELSMQLEKQHEHQDLVKQQHQQQQQQREGEEAERTSHSSSREPSSMSQSYERELPAIPQASSAASIDSSSRSFSRPHISQLALSGISEPLPGASALELPPILPAALHEASLASSPQSVRATKHNKIANSYSSNVCSRVAATTTASIGLPHTPPFTLKEISASAVDDTPTSSTHLPFLLSPATVIPATAASSAELQQQKQIKEQTTKLSRHDASLRASTRLQTASIMPCLPPSTDSSPLSAYSELSLADSSHNTSTPAPVYALSSPVLVSLQKHLQFNISVQPPSAPARVEDYRNRRLPDPPESPVYHLDIPDFDFDFDAEIRSLSAMCASLPRKSHYSAEEGAVDDLLDEVAIALQIAQYAAAAPKSPSAYSHPLRMANVA
ncbi:hypothetical protein TD95_003551 [Thielaviopsis punctulata]|uniref:BTB domain-containing protein n=1 Tax=Thielaviopsis punctulata TaxID=72032 RepID=A0A0F4ZI08_9PEZI|nr:hypothetical protein TD95_003551 [Thielaviopsis punctulata]